ncbi:Adenosine 3'-phospho 5'-phosphosulfate transporter 1 [Halotydeus destructor]|nr:Adenosine 3'-phospho 5'-phosphosulfate transporter 1 [Halotydeus destructor]
MSQHWLLTLARNTFGYSLILIPLILVVIVARRYRGIFLRIPILKQIAFSRKEWSVDEKCQWQRDIEGSLRGHQVAKKEKEVKKGGQDEDDEFSVRTILTFIFCVAGLYASFLVWGVFQEKIMITAYTVNHNTLNATTFFFKDSQFLVFANRISSTVIGNLVVIMSQVLPGSSHKLELFNAPLYAFAFCSLTNILSSWCQIEALKYIPYPTQVLSKACKIVPVMLMGYFMKKKYTRNDYIGALVITAGTALFMYEDAKNSPKASKIVSEYNLVAGLSLLALFLFMDAFTSNWQAYIFRENKPSSWEMMAMVNLYSFLLTFTSLLESGTFLSSAKLVLSHTTLLTHFSIMSITSASGQCFIYFTLQRFGPLTFVVVMTVRQVISIIISQQLQGHFISVWAWLGVCIIFATIFGQTYLKYADKQAKLKDNKTVFSTKL